RDVKIMDFDNNTVMDLKDPEIRTGRRVPLDRAQPSTSARDGQFIRDRIEGRGEHYVCAGRYGDCVGDANGGGRLVDTPPQGARVHHAGIGVGIGIHGVVRGRTSFFKYLQLRPSAATNLRLLLLVFLSGNEVEQGIKHGGTPLPERGDSRTLR